MPEHNDHASFFQHCLRTHSYAEYYNGKKNGIEHPKYQIFFVTDVSGSVRVFNQFSLNLRFTGIKPVNKFINISLTPANSIITNKGIVVYGIIRNKLYFFSRQQTNFFNPCKLIQGSVFIFKNPDIAVFFFKSFSIR